jgi:hypothetical protein
MQTVDAVMSDAVQSLRNHFSEMESLHFCGIHVGQQRVASATGEWLNGKLRAAVTDEFNDVITERRIRISDDGLACGAWRRGQPAANYYLSGQYFQLENALDIMLTLRDPEGGEHNFNGCINGNQVPRTVAVEMTGYVPGDLQRDVKGPIDFTLLSDRGEEPRYGFGDSAELTIELDQDAFVQCFYRNVNGQTFKVFPNPYHESALLPAGVTRIPGDEMPFEFEMGEPAGSEFLKCFATREDVSAKLPEAIRASDLEPLPPELADALAEAFRKAAPEWLTEDSIVINVLEPIEE